MIIADKLKQLGLEIVGAWTARVPPNVRDQRPFLIAIEIGRIARRLADSPEGVHGGFRLGVIRWPILGDDGLAWDPEGRESLTIIAVRTPAGSFDGIVPEAGPHYDATLSRVAWGAYKERIRELARKAETAGRVEARKLKREERARRNGPKGVE